MTVEENLKYGVTSDSVSLVVIIVLKERCEMDSIKIIIMVTWIGLNVLQGTESDDDIFVVGNGRCITNGSAALAIIKKIKDTDEEYDNKLASYYPKSESKCTFESNTNCGEEDFWEVNEWNICRAVDGPVKHYVTDRRWQDFPVYKFPSRLRMHKTVLNLNNFKIFTIPLSVRIESNGFVQLSLCDEKNRVPADCYSIRLTETQSNIWKCSQLYIIDKSNYYNYNCKKLDNGQAIKPFGVFNEDAWTHLRIVRNYTMIQLLRENDVIMTYYDEEPIFDTKDLLIYSERGSLWKVHDYHYLFSETPNHSSFPIGPVIEISKNTTCISMFVAMCQTCCLTITTSLQKGGEISEETEHYLSTPDGMWTEKKLIIDTHKHVGNTMSILHFKHQCNGNSNVGLFWAIDDIRFCEEKEYSYIQSDEEKFTCQKIGIGQNEILKIDNNDISKKGIDCPENTFGKFCVPCSMFESENDYCDKFVYCELDHSEEACHCTAGYGGINCLEECYWGFYGHGCQKECPKNCMKKICHENGTCSIGCKNPYTGSTCSESTVTFLKYAPNATTVTSTTGMIQVEDFAVETPAGSMPPSFYNIEYCEDPDQTVNRTSRNLGSKNWHIARKHIKFNDGYQVKIDNLMPDTFYLVRAIFSDQKAGDYIKESRFRTKCTDIVDENILIETTSDSATIEIQWAIDSCKLEKYKLICNNVEITKNLFKPIQLIRLRPYNEYNCTIKPAYSQDNIVKTFWTKEGVPSEVREVETVSDANSVSLKWKEPVTTNGKIIRYDIVYYYLGSRIYSCMSVHEMFNASTPQLNIILKGLKLYSKYQIMIYAVTNGGQGKEHKENIETIQSGNISREEMLAVDTFEILSDAVKISVTKLDCEDLTGPILIQGNASCIHEWCAGKNVSKRVKYSTDSNYIKLTGLFAYSNYTAYLAFSRDQISWNHIGNITLKTKPSVPKSISNLEVISKDDTSISLRWMKPYPPTGVLKQYCIEYSYYFRYLNATIAVDPEYISPLPCPLWKDYHCAKLTRKIYNGYKYFITISARNENPNTYGPASEITVEIKNEPSYPTYGISLLWDEKNDLNITWYHPNNTNGALRSFQIRLDTKRGQQKILEEYVRVNETNYSLTYRKTVNSTNLQACTQYRASIVVHNQYGANPSKDSSTTSPPDIPPNIPIENLETEKTITTITVHVPSVGSNSTLYQEKIYILVSKAADNDDLELFEQNLLQAMDDIPNLESSWVVYDSNRTNFPLDFRIGDDKQSESSLRNPPLEPGTNYSVTIIMSNQCANMMRLSRAQKYVSTLTKMDEVDEHTSNNLVPEESNEGLWALLLLFLVPLIGFGYWYKKYRHQKWSDLLNPYANPDSGGVRKYVIWCCSCGGLATILGVSFLAVHFSLRSYTSSLGYFETIPTFVPAILLILTGICVMSLARKKNRHSYLLQICSLCCLGCALTCVIVIITTTLIHMNRLHTLRKCVYTQKTRTCTCYLILSEIHATADDGSEYVFDATPNCEVIPGALYSCLRAMFGLSVSGLLVCIFSCMLVYQLLSKYFSHEKKKIHWEQLMLRFRSFYQQQNPSVPPGPQGSPGDSNVYHYVVHHNQGHESYCEMNNGNNQFRNKNNYENSTEPQIYQEPEDHTSVRNDGEDSSMYEEVLQTHKPGPISLKKPNGNPTKPVTEDEGYLEPRMCIGQMPNSPELDFSTDPCIQLLPSNIYQNCL